MTITELVAQCIANNGGTFLVSARGIRPVHDDSQDGRPMGVQPWSYNARFANPLGTKGLPGQDGMQEKYTDPAYAAFYEVRKKAGYLVSIAPYWERPKECPGMEWEFVSGHLKPETVYAYVVHHVTQFDLGAYLGLWYDGGKWYLNCTVHTESLGHALMLGKYYGQIAVWDCQWNRAVPVNEPRSFHELSEEPDNRSVFDSACLAW